MDLLIRAKSMVEKVVYQAPTFLLWKETHKKQSQVVFDAKNDTRKAYHWVVLTYLKYDVELIGVEQSTWFGKYGPTAFGAILSAWNSRGRQCFLVDARNRTNTDTYLVVFEKNGKFVTLYSKSREDIPDKEFVISKRVSVLLLRLSYELKDDPLRRITNDAIYHCLARKSAINKEKHYHNFISRTIPKGIEVGIIEERNGNLFLKFSHEIVEKKVERLNPFGWEDFIWSQHKDIR